MTVLGATVAIVTACSGAEQTPATDSTASETVLVEPAPSGASVQILSPAEGDTVTLPFTMTLGATGVEVIAANGLREEGKGHHHLVVDGDAPSTDSLPLAPAPIVIHMGTGATERVFDSLSPGPHRVIAIFAAGDHVPFTTVTRDTVTFVVKR